MNRELIRRGGPALAAVAAVCLLSSQAAFAQYKTRVVVSTKDTGGGQYQPGDLNNNGQFSMNIVGAERDSGGGGETSYFFDGTNLIRFQPHETKLSDGSTLTSGNMWTPHGINDAGKVAYAADTDNSPKAIVVWNSADKTYKLISKNTTVVEGGTLTSAGVALEGRMVADINNKDQVVWSEGLTPADGSDATDAVFMYDPATDKITTIARKGTVVNGKTILGALFPNINEDSQVVFMANTTDNENYGVYQWEAGNITVIAAPGTVVDGVTIASAKLPRNATGGHVVFRGETTPSGSGAPQADDTGYFIYTGGKLSKIAAPGDALPVGGKMVSTEGNRRAIGVNAKGQVVFKAVMEGDASGVFLWEAGKITPIIASGQSVEAAGTVASVVQGLGDYNGYHLAINDHGDVITGGVIDGNQVVIMATAPR